VAYEVESPIGIDVHAVIGLIIQLEGERQADKRRTVIGMITNVGRARHDRIGSLSDRVIGWRTTLDIVIPCEGGIAIASFSSDRPGPNAGCYAASESEMYRELGSAASDANRGYAAANVAGQSQIARVDRPWINSLVKVHIIRVVAWCWWRERAANRRVSRSNLQRRYNVTERAQELEVPHPVRNTIKCAGWDIHRLQSLREDRRAGVVEGDLCIAIGEGRWQVRRGSVHCEIACLNS